jgi:membrane protein
MASSWNLAALGREYAQTFVDTMQTWPWMDTVRTLRQRFRDDRLGLTASSLTFTTLIALVPLVTVMLAIFSAFPMFAGFQSALEKYFLQNLVPPNIAQPVLRAVTQFATKATQMGSAGLAALVVTAFALVLTIDRTLNSIWRVRRKRPLAQRLLVYWATLTLGPLLVGVSLTFMTYAFTNTSRSGRSTLVPGAELVFGVVELVLFALGVAALFRFVPNTFVRWRHALAGGVFVAVGVQLAKRGLALYVGATPLYTNVYGAFATVPIFLLWLYLMWVIVLLGAVIAAYAPSLSLHMMQQTGSAGHRFAMALSMLRLLVAARQGAGRGLTSEALAKALLADPLLVEPIAEALTSLDWVARVDEPGAARWVLLVDPNTTPATPLIDRLLLVPGDAVALFRQHAQLDRLTLGALL